MTTDSGKQGLKIAELSRVTGLSKQTIHYYMREGLLDPPTKTHPNVAFYDWSHVDRLLLIKKLKQEQRLTIAEIRERLRNGAAGFLDEEVITSALTHAPAHGQRMSRRALLKESGLKMDSLRFLAGTGLLVSLESDGQETFSATDLDIAKSFQRILDTGCPPAIATRIIAPYIEGLAKPVRNEVESLFDIPLSPSERETVASALGECETAIEGFLTAARRVAIERETRTLIGELRKRADEVAHFYRDTTGVAHLSGEYLKRLGVTTVIRRLKEMIKNDPSDLDLYASLITIYFAKGDYSQLLAWSKKGIEREPTNTWMLFYLGMAYLRNSRTDQAMQVFSRCLELDERFAMARMWLGGSMLMAAVKESELTEALSLVRGGVAQIDRAKDDLPEDTWQLVNFKGMRGKTLSMLPRFMGRHEEGMAELKESLELTLRERGQSQDPYFCAFLDLTALSRYLALGEEYDADGMIVERDEAWKAFLEIDPKNDLAGMIRARMSEDREKT